MRKAILGMTFLLLISIFSGCAKESTSPESKNETQQTETKDTEEKATLDGKQLAEERCTSCHGLDRIESVEYDRAGWEATIDRMISKGAKLSDDEKGEVLEYLANK